MLQVLDHPEQCYAVVLSAVDGIAFPPPPSTAASAAAAPPSTATSAAAAAAAAAPRSLPAAQPDPLTGRQHRQSAGRGAVLPPAAAAAAAATDGESAATARGHQQPDRSATPPQQLDLQRAPVPAAREAAGPSGAEGGAPAEGVTLWQYVSEGGESVMPVDSRAVAAAAGDLRGLCCFLGLTCGICAPGAWAVRQRPGRMRGRAAADVQRLLCCGWLQLHASEQAAATSCC